MVMRGVVHSGGGVLIALGLACDGGGAANRGVTSSASVGSGAGGQQANCDERYSLPESCDGP
ncbi:MAG: hypothetical protein VB934_00455 [Polyangiaceae bacterium]